MLLGYKISNILIILSNTGVYPVQWHFPSQSAVICAMQLCIGDAFS